MPVRSPKLAALLSLIFVILLFQVQPGLAQNDISLTALAPSPIPQAGWQVVYVDSQETQREFGWAENAIDGNIWTIWHTDWSTTSPAPPHEIQIDLGASYEVAGLAYLPRQDGINGTISQYEIYTSLDGASWGSPAAEGSWAANNDEKVVEFSARTARFVRLRALAEINGNPWTSAAEINVLGAVSGGTPIPTGTATPFAPTPTLPTATVTATMPPGDPNLIFADSFETGGLQGWSAAVTDGGDVAVSTQARLVGMYGMQVLIDDNNVMYVEDRTPASEKSYNASFYFDPNAIQMSSGNAHYLFYGYAGSSTVVLQVEFRYYSGTYQLRAGALNDRSSWSTSNWVSISDESHLVALKWLAATAAGRNNGSLTFSIDGVQRATFNQIDNDTRRIDSIRLGPVSSIDSGTRGTYYIDNFESHR